MDYQNGRSSHDKRKRRRVRRTAYFRAVCTLICLLLVSFAAFELVGLIRGENEKAPESSETIKYPDPPAASR